MNQQGFHLLVLYLIFFFIRIFSCEAQVPSNNNNTAPSPSSQDIVTNFRPSLAVVMAILGFLFFVTFFLLIYVKCCSNRGDSLVHGNPSESQPWLIRTRSTRFSGIDKAVIESLPFFRFSSLKGSKEGLECAVCLSKFEDVEILRLLPKCKHAFHINCIDYWLENHSSCPLCRHKVDPEDHTIFTYSNSLRLLINGGAGPDLGGEESSNLGLFVQREEEEEEQNNGSSSRFNFGSSFRRIMNMKGSSSKEEDELPIKKPALHDDHRRKVYHTLKHRISVSDFVLKNRWSNVSSSDLMFLNSEMIGSASSLRFNNNGDQCQVTCTGEAGNDDELVIMMNLKEEMERKVSFENKVSGVLKKNNHNSGSDSAENDNLKDTSKYIVNPDEKRSVSDITAVSRFGGLGMKIFGNLNNNNDNNNNNNNTKGSSSSSSSSLVDDQKNVKEERVRQIWLPIAKRTVQWFVNRERRIQQSINSNV